MQKLNLTITIKILTGLHIGVGGDKAQIGGIDSQVIKDPITKVPYIPGSSLKGKLRCLLETEANDIYSGGENNPKINKYFGATSDYTKKRDGEQKNGGKVESANDANESTQVEESLSKFIFRDLKMVKSQETEYLNGKYPLEAKTEISIDRKKGTVTNAGPRTIERIPPGTVFTGEVIFRYNENSKVDEKDEMRKMLDKAVELLKNDALGGSGSRGYGAVEINLTTDDSSDVNGSGIQDVDAKV